MDNIFDSSPASRIIERIDQLQADSQPAWGKMNVSQMLLHCASFQDIATGEQTASRSWLGLLVGKLAKPILFNDKPIPHNMSTIPNLIITDTPDFGQARETLKHKILSLQDMKRETGKMILQPHPFFGKLSDEEWGKGMYKHLDHHLKQFGV